MPSHVTFFRRTQGPTEPDGTPPPRGNPVTEQIIDDELRAAFGAEPCDKTWYANWGGRLGDSLSLGQTFSQMRDWIVTNNFTEDRALLVAVCCWLDLHFTTSAYRTFGR